MNVTIFESGNQTTFPNFINIGTNVNNFRETNPTLRLLQLYIQPIIGAIGIIGNSLTFIILSKLGFRKPSNMLILSLTLADTLYLFRTVNALHLVSRFGHQTISFSYTGWETPENLSFCLFTLERLSAGISYLGGYVSTGLPVLITTERFIATFFPLKFKQIVTTKRTLMLNTALWLFWIPLPICSLFLYSLRSTVSPSGKVIYYMTITYQFISDSYMFNLFETYIFNFLSSIVPLCLVCIGCVLVGVKLNFAQRQRKRMVTSRKTKSLRTTRTLLSVSTVFAVMHSVYFTITCVFADEKLKGSLLNFVVNEMKYTLLFVCSSSNFFIYVIMNSKFRKQLAVMFSKNLKQG